jgi:hypothetical protein
VLIETSRSEKQITKMNRICKNHETITQGITYDARKKKNQQQERTEEIFEEITLYNFPKLLADTKSQN